MPEEEKKNISRRQFLKDAGLVVGGATVGSAAILSACGDKTTTVTTTATKTVDGGTKTVTVTPTAENVYICPLDETKCNSLAELQSHFSANHPGASLNGLTELRINGKSNWLKVDDRWTLSYVIREVLHMTGTKRACERGECGVCTVLMEGRPVLSCMVLACEAGGKDIVTIEGLEKGDGTLDPVQQAFVDYDAVQCGFCTPGQILTAKALLAFKPKPTTDEIKEFMGGVLCRCGVYYQIDKAIESLAK